MNTTTSTFPDNGSALATVSTRKSVQDVAADFPQDWPLLPLGSFYLFSNGANSDKGAYGSGVPFINVLEVLNHTHINARHIPGRVRLPTQIVDSFSVRRGDILFNRTSETQEEVGLASTYADDATVIFGGFVIRARPIDNTFDPTYAGYGFRAPAVRRQIIAKGQGAIRANIGQTGLKSVLVPIPPMPEQRAIAATLSDVDELIGALDKLIAKKRAIKLATMQQLLTGKTRLPGFVRVPGQQRTELGEIPQDWRCTNLGKEIDLLTGFPFPSAQYVQSGVRLVRGSNVKRGVMDWSQDILQFWPSISPDISRYELQVGDLVVAMDGALVGRSYAVISQQDLPALLLQRVARIRSEKIHRKLLPYLVESEAFVRHVDSVKTHTAIPHISPADIRSFVVAIPSTITEQEAIADVLLNMDTEIVALEQRCDKTKAIKQGMMQSLLTGRIRLMKPEGT